jgi:hypothetical protein
MTVINTDKKNSVKKNLKLFLFNTLSVIASEVKQSPNFLIFQEITTSPVLLVMTKIIRQKSLKKYRADLNFIPGKSRV